MMYELQVWDDSVVDELLQCYDEFLAETQYPITPDREAGRERLETAYIFEGGDVLYVRDDDTDELAGGAVVYAMADWQKEKFGYVEKFFIRPKFRRTMAARQLGQGIAHWFDKKQCMFSFVTATANIGSDRLFTNLMAKYGYSITGPTLIREIPDGKIRT